MSGGPPSHHSHGLPTNAWNHLQIPNYYPGRQPQHAHMSNEHPYPMWHTPTTEPVKPTHHSHLFNLEQMINTRHSPGVDLSTRNGQAPISLSVRDAKQINSLPMGALDGGPPTILPQQQQLQQTLSPKKTTPPPPPPSVIMSTTNSSHDENSNGSLTATTQDDEDSADSGGKSRRKRKPLKTVRVNREEEIVAKDIVDAPAPSGSATLVETPVPITPTPPPPPPPAVVNVVEKSTDTPVDTQAAGRIVDDSLEKESIASIEAEVKAIAAEDKKSIADVPVTNDVTAISKKDVDDVVEALKSPVPVTNTVDSSESTVPAETTNLDESDEVENASLSQPKDSQTNFVAVEDELEKMFAGIGDTKLPESESASTSNQESQQQQAAASLSDTVTSTSNDVSMVESSTKSSHKRGRPKGSKNQSNSRRNSQETTPKKKHKMSKKKSFVGGGSGAAVIALRDESPKPCLKRKKKSTLDGVKDVYAYDSGSNTSSTKSKGPFVHIRGPRDSPISVNVINGPVVDDDTDTRKVLKSKKFHDDSEYRHKVRTKGLHCSTLSNKYDAQTKDVTWICVFCKRGPHAAEPLSGIVGTPQYSPGDLFGPYIITTNCSEYQRRLSDPFDLQFKSKKALATSNNSTSPAGGGSGTKKTKRKLHPQPALQFVDPTGGTSEEFLEGMVDGGSGTYEVWVHEDCIVWSPGVYLVGAKIVGLEGAVWSACSVQCGRCQLRGAALSCLKRGCNSHMHVGCAKLSGWILDEDTYKTYCAHHRPL